MCPAGDTNCTTKSGARAGNAVIILAGAAATGYGLWRLIGGRSEIDTTQRSPSVSRVLAQYPCRVPLNNVAVTLAVPRQLPVTVPTDADGNAVFILKESGALRILFIELGRMSVNGREMGRVALDQVLLPSFKRAGFWPTSATALTPQQRWAWSTIFCMLKQEGMAKCQEALG